MQAYVEWDDRYLEQVRLPGDFIGVPVSDVLAAQPVTDAANAIRHFRHWAELRGCRVFELTTDVLVLGRHYPYGVIGRD